MYGPAVPFTKGIFSLPEGAAASLLKGIYIYWKERPPPWRRIYVWSGRPFYKGNLYFTSRSGRFFYKGYTKPSPPAASLLKGIYIYWKERPPLWKRIYVWSGRLFHKGNLYFTWRSGRLFAKGNLYLLEGAAATLKKDICMVRPSLS